MADLDLDALRPPNSSFTHRGRRYEVPAELAVETIVEALQLREKFEAAETADDEAEMVAAMEAMRGIVWSMLDEADPDQIGKAPAEVETMRLEPLADLPLGTVVHLPGGIRITKTEARDGDVLGLTVERRSYPRLSIEEITAVLTLGMGGGVGQSPRDVVKAALEGDEEERGGGSADDPTGSAASSRQAPDDEVLPAVI